MEDLYHIVARHAGDYRVRKMTCAEHFQILAFVQLPYRESLRDIKAGLSAQAAKLWRVSIRLIPLREKL